MNIYVINETANPNVTSPMYFIFEEYDIAKVVTLIRKEMKKHSATDIPIVSIRWVGVVMNK